VRKLGREKEGQLASPSQAQGCFAGETSPASAAGGSTGSLQPYPCGWRAGGLGDQAAAPATKY